MTRKDGSDEIFRHNAREAVAKGPGIDDRQRRGRQTVVGQDKRSSVQFPTILTWTLSKDHT